MKAQTLALLAQAVSLIVDHAPEFRERCADTTHAKFVSLKNDLEVAIQEHVNAPPEAPAPLPPVLEQFLSTLTPEFIQSVVEQGMNTLSDSVALAVHAAFDEREKATG